MHRAPRRVPKIAVRPADEHRRSSGTNTEENIRNLLSTSRFRAHDADSATGCLGAPMRYGVFSLEDPDSER
jgi:hypothetical protein